jgi:hypothetical protein
MTTFILIMTLVTPGYSGRPVAGVTTVEFMSKESCEIAGHTWFKESVIKLGDDSERKSSFICVKK